MNYVASKKNHALPSQEILSYRVPQIQVSFKIFTEKNILSKPCTYETKLKGK
jgi:hypothetical protein